MAVTSKVQNLGKDLIAKAFTDHGYKPTATDLQWWATQPNSSYTKLVSNLVARRKKDDDAHKKTIIDQKQTQSSQDIQAPQGQGAGNSPVSVAKDNAQGSSGVVASQINGKTKTYNLGKYSLVRFDDSPTVFLADFKNKELRPFLSEQAFNSSYANPQEAWASIHVLPSQEHTNPNGALGDFSLLPADYGVSNNGAFLKDPDYRVNNVKKHYGQPEISVNQAYQTNSKLYTILSGLQKNTQSGIDPTFISKEINNPELMSFYANAITYGGYSLSDIYKDLRKRELSESGDNSYSNMRYIDDVVAKSQYISTPNGKAADQDKRISIPTSVMADNPQLWDVPLSQLPQDAFRALGGDLNNLSPQNQADAAKIQSDFHDVLMAKLNATTDAQKAVADNNYKGMVNYIQDRYGTMLSSNVTQAWAQIQNLSSNMENSGLLDSGIKQEQIDSYLKETRKQNEKQRATIVHRIGDEQAQYMQNYGSSSDIKKLDDEDAAKGLPRDQWRSVLWGLKPSQSFTDSISAQTLKSKFPNLTDDQINDYRNQLIDENGNLRSNLYAKQYEQMYNLQKGNTIDQSAGSATKDEFDANGNLVRYGKPANESLSDYQQRMERQKLLDQENTGEQEFNKRQNDFEKQAPLNTNAPGSQTPPFTPAPAPTQTQNPAVNTLPPSWAPPSGTQHIGTPSDIKNYTGVVKDPNSSALWGTLKPTTPSVPAPKLPTPAPSIPAVKPPPQVAAPQPVKAPPAPSWNMPTGYEKINGALYNTSEKQKAAYTGIQRDPSNTFLYGKKI